MKLNYKLPILALTLIIGTAFFYILGGTVLALVYAILWVDKIIIGMVGTVRYLGIEFTTIATVIIGISYGPVNAFIFSIVMIPLLHAAKYIFLPLPQPEWPYFIPHPNNVVDALGAAFAGVFAGLPLLFNTLIVVFLKDVGYALSERYMIGKPIDYFSAIMYLVFNALLAIQFGPAIMALV
jgi:hypothetical protein